MLVSYVVTCYNTENFLPECLASIRKQTYANYEIVFVNDGGKKLDIVGDDIRSVQFDENRGYGFALHTGIAMSKGEIVVVLDSDDYLIGDGTIEKCVYVHKEHPDVSMTYSNYYSLHGSGMSPVTGSVIPVGKTVLGTMVKDTYHGTEFRVSHLKVFKRAFYDKTEGLDPTLRKAVDRDLILKLEEVGKLHYIPEFMYAHRIHGISISSGFGKLPKGEQEKIMAQKLEMYRKAFARRGISC